MKRPIASKTVTLPAILSVSMPIIKISSCACFILLLLTVLNTPVHAYMVDDFNDTQAPIALNDGVNGSAMSTKVIAGVLGGERQISLYKYGTAGFYSGETTGGLIDINISHTNIDGGSWSVIYDGIHPSFDPAGLGSVDLTDAGVSNALRIDLVTAPLGSLSYLEVRAYSNANWSSYKVMTPTAGILSIPFSTFLLQGGSGADFSSVGALEVMGRFRWNVGVIDPYPTEGTSFEINYIDTFGAAITAPEPATMLLLGFGLIGLAGVRRKINK
jgi:hypothetical protein